MLWLVSPGFSLGNNYLYTQLYPWTINTLYYFNEDKKTCGTVLWFCTSAPMWGASQRPLIKVRSQPAIPFPFFWIVTVTRKAGINIRVCRVFTQVTWLETCHVIIKPVSIHLNLKIQSPLIYKLDYIEISCDTPSTQGGLNREAELNHSQSPPAKDENRSTVTVNCRAVIG